MNGSARPPRFQVFVVGLPKTGTTSIAKVFQRHNSRHEFMFGKTVERIVAFHQGGVGREAFQDFVLERHARGGLEMDSASFNHYYLDILADAFAEARFVFTIRDCFSWLNSYVSMLLRWRRTFSRVDMIPDWLIAYGRMQFGRFDPEDFSSPGRIRERMPDLAVRFLRCWGDCNRRIIEVLPAERSLVIRTDHLSASIPELAQFVSVSVDSLLWEAGHSNRASETMNFLDGVDQKPIERAYSRFCSDLMATFFREHDVDTALSSTFQSLNRWGKGNTV